MNAHSFSDAIQAYLDAEAGTEYVIDVGVQELTKPLIDCLPSCKHYLFEPLVLYREVIERNYEGIEYELIQKAVSNKTSTLYQHAISQDNSGRVTHSHLRESNKQDPTLAGMYVDIIETEVTTLDRELGFLLEDDIINCIVKIDVDGEDTNVMRGMNRLASHCGLLIVEAPTGKILERVSIANDMGFDIFDVTSPGYYFNQLSQVDIFFVNRELKSRNINLRPWSKSNGLVVWEEWNHIS
jgi:FkbM family methyltransferase